MLGIGGAGLSGAARVLVARGHRVSGQDRARSDFVSAIERLGIEVDVGASAAERLPASTQALVRSAAIGPDDPQIVEARSRGIPVWKYSELLGRLAPPRRTLAIAGTHGKTTSTWMCWHALAGLARAAGKGAPSAGAIVGGTHKKLGTNALPQDEGGWFAVEACEYDRSFLQLAPEGAIVTNVEPDHLDYYGSFAAIQGAFARFADRVHPEGLLVLGREVPELVEDAARCQVWRLGREIEVDLLGEVQGRFLFRLRAPGWATPTVALLVPGSFNVDNAALAIALAVGTVSRAWQLEPADAAREVVRDVSEFTGVQRRFESWGSVGGIDVVHDYAHHPTEVRVTIEAARRSIPARFLHVLFQPHQHSRTARFLPDFVEALRGADRVVVADVYGARAHIDTQAAGSSELVRRLKLADVLAEEGGTCAQVVQRLVRGVTSGSAVLVLGAGDIDGIKDDLLRELAVRGTGTRGPVR
jgi:UDP-N-acetylmuramate--alanine ligase